MKRLLRIAAVCLLGMIVPASPTTASETITYAYDALGRLTAVQSAGDVNNGQSATTTYDAAGNRTNQTVTGVGGGSSANLAIGNASVTEGGTLSFTVTRSGTTTTAVSASYATASGTATSGSDFTAASGTVSFAAGETTKTIPVATIDDSTVESAETMTVTLSSPSSGATITTATGTGTINDNDSGGGGGGGCAGVTAIVPAGYSASSTWPAYAYTGLSGTGAGMRDGVYDTLASMHGTNSGANQWVMMSLGSAQAVGNVIVADALASAPGSWGPTYLNGAVLEKSSDGSTWTSVATVSGAADNVPVTIAVNATVQYLRLRMPSGYLGIGDFCATAGSGGGSANLAIGNASVTEGGTLSFTVTRSGNTSSAVSASYATASGTATSGSDFTVTSGTVSFAAGETTKTITVATIDDSTVESAETMTVTLSSPSSGATITTATGTGTINDNDSGGGGGGGCAGVTAIVPAGYSASSTWPAYAYTGLSGTGAGMRDGVYDTLASMHGTNSGANQWVMMSLGSAQAVGNVIVADALASAPGSWGPTYLNGAVLEKSSDGSTWTSVATVSGAADNVPVTIAVNASVQYLRLRMPSGYLGVGDFCATAGSGGGGGATIAIGNASVTEGGTLSFTVTRSGNTSSAVSASYATASGTATSGSDFTVTSGTVSFAAGETTKTITVATIDDSTVESAETMTVTLSSPSSGAIITTATGTGTINDNDGPIQLTDTSLHVLTAYQSTYSCYSNYFAPVPPYPPYYPGSPGYTVYSCVVLPSYAAVYQLTVVDGTSPGTPTLATGYSVTGTFQLSVQPIYYGTP